MGTLRRPGFGLAIGALIVAAVVFVARGRGPVVATTVATRMDLDQHIVASGRVRVVTRIQLSAQVSGRVVAVHVVEGQHTKAGDLLVHLDDAEATAAVALARAAVSQAAGRVEQLRNVGAVVTTEAFRQAATGLARAEAELARSEALAAAGAVPQADLDEARRGVDIARAQWNAAEAQQAATTSGGADVRIALSVPPHENWTAR